HLGRTSFLVGSEKKLRPGRVPFVLPRGLGTPATCGVGGSRSPAPLSLPVDGQERFYAEDDSQCQHRHQENGHGARRPRPTPPPTPGPAVHPPARQPPARPP